MAPSHTISAHLCKQIYASWRQTRQPAPSSGAATTAVVPIGGPARTSPSPERHSVDSNDGGRATSPLPTAGSASMSRQPSASSGRFGGSPR